MKSADQYHNDALPDWPRLLIGDPILRISEKISTPRQSLVTLGVSVVRGWLLVFPLVGVFFLLSIVFGRKSEFVAGWDLATTPFIGIAATRIGGKLNSSFGWDFHEHAVGGLGFVVFALSPMLQLLLLSILMALRRPTLVVEVDAEKINVRSLGKIALGRRGPKRMNRRFHRTDAPMIGFRVVRPVIADEGRYAAAYFPPTGMLETICFFFYPNGSWGDSADLEMLIGERRVHLATFKCEGDAHDFAAVCNAAIRKAQ